MLDLRRGDRALRREVHESMHRPLVGPLRAKRGARFDASKSREQLTIGVLRIIAREMSLNVEAVGRGRHGPVNQVCQGSTNRHGLGGRDIGNELEIFHFSMVRTKIQFCRKWVSELF